MRLVTESIRRFARAVECWERRRIMKMCPNMDADYFDRESFVEIKPGRKWIKVDVGRSGRYMIDPDREYVYAIKAYGVPHLGRRYGTVTALTLYLESASDDELARKGLGGVRYGT